MARLPALEALECLGLRGRARDLDDRDVRLPAARRCRTRAFPFGRESGIPVAGSDRRGALSGDLPGVPPFRPAGQAVNYVAGFNVLSIVVELPSALLEGGSPGKLNIWGTISR